MGQSSRDYFSHRKAMHRGKQNERANTRSFRFNTTTIKFYR
jgi:hypothetical protein